MLNAPVSRPPAGETRTASRDDDAFARVLDAERDDRDAAERAETTQTTTPPAPVQAQPEVTLRESEGTETGSDASAGAAAEFHAALNALSSDGSEPTASVVNAGANKPAVDPTVAAAATVDPVTVQPEAVVAVQAAQTSAAAIALASTAGPVVAEAAGEPIDAKSESTDSSDSADVVDGADTPVAALAPPTLIAAATSLANGQTDATSIKPDETTTPAAPERAATSPAPSSPTAPEGDVAANAAPPKAETASQPPAQGAPAPHPAASSAVQATQPAQASAAQDGAAAAAPVTSTQPAAPANPLADASRAVATPPALQSAPAATIEVYSRMIERADGRAQRFEVRLDPVELGRVDVRIEIGADRKVHAVLAAHDSAALADLTRGQRALERALSDAGIDLADKGIRFELSTDSGRGGASQQRDGEASGRPSQPDAWRKFDTTTLPVTVETAAAATPQWRPQRLDLVA